MDWTEMGVMGTRGKGWGKKGSNKNVNDKAWNGNGGGEIG